MKQQIILGLLTALIILPAMPVLADEPMPGYQAQSLIESQALSQVHGLIGVNQSAGDANVQANDRAIAVSADGGVAIAQIHSLQALEANQANMPEAAVTRIENGSFHKASGLISVNQVSGVSNRQANAFAMATSIEGELSDLALAVTLSDAPAARSGPATPSASRRDVHVDADAFVAAQGVVQLNQAAGKGNVASNRIEMLTLSVN